MEPEEIAAQLRCPGGAEGPEVARRMNEANGPVNRKCIDLLQLRASDRVLEIGPGNGAFAREIVGAADGVSYTGVDWSADMVAQATEANRPFVSSGHMHFLRGSSDRLPFPSATFDKALAVHTIYFWERPAEHLAEIRHVLRPHGLFCIAFGDEAFMRELPFTPFGFSLYDMDKARRLLQGCGFRLLDFHQQRETGSSNSGEVVDKVVNIILCDSQ